MRRKREEIASPEATQRLRAIWDAKKRELKLTQELAAELMGFEAQSAVSH
ncbi:transcriptional regulator, partial [Escherichia coli O157]|nr:transcriptional regulator [Escherichia coli O157]